MKTISPAEIARRQREQWDSERRAAEGASASIAVIAEREGIPSEDAEAIKTGLAKIGVTTDAKRRFVIGVLSIALTPPGGVGQFVSRYLTARNEMDAPADDAQQEADMLLGSNVQPAVLGMPDGGEVQLGDVVARAHQDSGMSIADWNALDDDIREGLIQVAYEAMHREVADRVTAAPAAPEAETIGFSESEPSAEFDVVASANSQAIEGIVGTRPDDSAPGVQISGATADGETLPPPVGAVALADMNKKELAAYAKDTFGIDLDKRLKLEDLMLQVQAMASTGGANLDEKK